MQQAGMDGGVDWVSVRNAAERSLARWRDPLTQSLREDLVQEAVVQTWRCSAGGGVRSLPGLAWTIAQRLRLRALRRQQRLPMESLDGLQLADRVGEPPRFGIAGRSLTAGELWPIVARDMGRRGGTNVELVHRHYSGTGTRELANGFGLTRNGVKRRLYRERGRLRRAVVSELAGGAVPRRRRAPEQR